MCVFATVNTGPVSRHSNRRLSCEDHVELEMKQWSTTQLGRFCQPRTGRIFLQRTRIKQNASISANIWNSDQSSLPTLIGVNSRAPWITHTHREAQRQTSCLYKTNSENRQKGKRGPRKVLINTCNLLSFLPFDLSHLHSLLASDFLFTQIDQV